MLYETLSHISEVGMDFATRVVLRVVIHLPEILIMTGNVPVFLLMFFFFFFLEIHVDGTLSKLDDPDYVLYLNGFDFICLAETFAEHEFFSVF